MQFAKHRKTARAQDAERCAATLDRASATSAQDLPGVPADDDHVQRHALPSFRHVLPCPCAILGLLPGCSYASQARGSHCGAVHLARPHDAVLKPHVKIMPPRELPSFCQTGACFRLMPNVPMRALVFSTTHHDPLPSTHVLIDSAPHPPPTLARRATTSTLFSTTLIHQL